MRQGRNLRLEVEHLEVADDVWLGDDVVIRARVLRLGAGTRLEDRVQIGGARGGPADYIAIGEQCLLGNDVKVALPVLQTGDYVSVHNHTLLNGNGPMVLGHNNWVGQNCLLNSEAPLWLGNNVGIGAYSGVYTHGYWGEALEGCRICKIAPVRLDDDVWILGSYNVISPGVEVGAKATVLTGSVVTRSVAPGEVVGGSPARPMNWSEPMYQPPSLERKLEMMREFLAEFLAGVEHVVEPWGFRVLEPSVCVWFGEPPPGLSGYQVGVRLTAQSAADHITLFDLSGRRYFRTRHPFEVRLLKFLKSYRARFVPADYPRVELPVDYATV